MTAVLRPRYNLFSLIYTALPYIFLALLVWYDLSAILRLNQGRFTYSLDDPYIHLALAGRIAQGSYGINPGEIAAPASSILWPFLLAPLAWVPFFDLIPLIYNLLLAAATVFIYTKIVSTCLDASGFSRPQLIRASAWITAALIPATNLVGLAFTGMEHSLQVFLCAVIVLGTIYILQGRADTPAWLIAALIAAPLIRYETLTVTLPALAVLLFSPNQEGGRRWKTGLLTLAGILLGLGAFSLFLHTNGLGWLPTSVIAKVSLANYRPTHNFIFDHIRNNMAAFQGPVLGGLLLLLVLLAAVRRNAPRIERGLALAAAAGVLAHLSAGQIGWWDRYEVYIVAASSLWVLYLARGLFGWIFSNMGGLASAGVLFGLSLLIGRPYYANIGLTPDAASNIYEQQYQMHRFAVDYLKGPVAVNDLGWVAYHNPNYVLDLWGLGSKEALDNRTQAGPAQVGWMDQMTSQHQIRLVMIYDTPHWFPNHPSGWTAVAHLYLGHPQYSAGDYVVGFYVPDAGEVETVRSLLRAFAPTLPPGVRMTIAP